MRRMQDADGLDQLLESGRSGYFPLFFQDWIVESVANLSEVRKKSFSEAAETVHRVYKQIEQYQTLEKKKVAIQALQDDERKDFILSFMKMVEFRALDDMGELQ